MYCHKKPLKVNLKWTRYPKSADKSTMMEFAVMIFILKTSIKIYNSTLQVNKTPLDEIQYFIYSTVIFFFELNTIYLCNKYEIVTLIKIEIMIIYSIFKDLKT